MKGVILAPILAAFLAAATTGSSTFAAVAFFAVLGIEALVITGAFKNGGRF